MNSELTALPETLARRSRSAKDSITQNEESKIDYDYLMMLRNNKFEHTVEIETSNNAPLNYFFLLLLSYGI